MGIDGEPNVGPRGGRLATALYVAPIAVSSVIGVLVLLGAWATAMRGGTGMDASQRPTGFVLLACVGAFGWFTASSALYALYIGSWTLPRSAARFGRCMLIRETSLEPPAPPAPALRFQTRVSPENYLTLTFLEIPLFTFIAPLLIGYLLAPGAYWPSEVVVVALMALFVVIWSAWLVRRAIRHKHPPQSSTRPG